MTNNHFIESILCYNSKIPFLDYHLDRIHEAKECLKNTPSIDFKKYITEFGKHLNYGKIRLSWNENEFLIANKEINKNHFFNKTAINISTHKSYQKKINESSQFKTSRTIDYNTLNDYCDANNVSQCILLNQNHNLIETNISNIFLIINNEILCPDLNSGCVNGVFRKIMLKYFDIKERSLSIQDMIAADGVFLTNAIRGIQIVKSIDNHQIKTHKSLDFQRLAFNKISSLYL